METFHDNKEKNIVPKSYLIKREDVSTDFFFISSDSVKPIAMTQTLVYQFLFEIQLFLYTDCGAVF